jgi:hypothetical protein
MLTPAFGQTSTQGSPTNQPTGLREAQHMVPARASLTHALDAGSVHDGDQFRATLSDNVHLNDAVELHRGDMLLGKVVTDDMNTTGKSRLAVRFTEVHLKNGQAIPIKATIVALYTPNDLLGDEYNEPTQIPNSWNDGTLRVDQEDVVNGVDLHSQISSQNSGVFVAPRKNNFKIPAGSEVALAISARPNASPTNAGL